MKKKVLRERRHKDSETILNELADKLITEIVEEAKPTKKKASKKKEA